MRTTKLINILLAAYTSLLRITTTPPAKEAKDVDDTRDSTSTEGATPATTDAAVPTAVTTPIPPPRGLASLRPNFLRGLSRASNNAPVTAPATQTPDLERGPEAVGA